jgi:hypothetical protein
MRTPLLIACCTSLLACSSGDFTVGGPREAASVHEDTAAVPAEASSEEDAEPSDTTIAADAEAPDTLLPPGDARPEISALDTGCTSPATCPSGTECQVATCTSGVCGVANRTAGLACSTGKCDGAGKCVACLNATHCPGTTDPCKMGACIAGACAIVPKPAGAFCNGYEDQCDGAGNCVDCFNSGGCGECCVCSANKCVPA